jgi:flagellin
MMEISSTGINSGFISDLSKSSTQIASGKKINSSADSPSSVQILEQFNSQISGNQQAHRNILDGVSALQIAQGGLSQITDSLHQLRELGIQAGNGTLNADNRQALQKQGSELIASIKDALGQSQLNGLSLLTTNESQASNNSIQTGSDQNDRLALPSFDLVTQFDNAGLFALDFSTPENVSQALNSIDASLNLNDVANGELGIAQKRLDFSASRLSDSTINQASARSQIQDTDYAAAVSEQTKRQLSEDVKLTLLAQANAQRGDVIKLLDI